MLDAFSEDYIPATIVGREEEKQAIAFYLKDVLHGRTSKILYIHGIPGIGKTVVTRHVLNQFENEVEEAVVVYVNCRNSSYYQCLERIYSECFRKNSRRISSKEILRAFTRRLHKDLILVCALDNFDKLRDLDFFVSSFLEMRKSIPRCGLILISTSGNNPIEILGKRLYYSIRFETIIFKPYSLDEIVEIIKSRLKEACGGVIADELALFEIASFVRNSSQNVRHAFWIVQNALEMLDNNADKITAEIARKAIEKEIKSGCLDSK